MRLDSKNPDWDPLLIIAGTADNTVPLAITHATRKFQSKNPGSPRIVEIPGRGTRWSSTAAREGSAALDGAVDAMLVVAQQRGEVSKGA
jgi:hypothetical protein